jgi:membrane protein YqaA with SNARE-associated domain
MCKHVFVQKFHTKMEKWSDIYKLIAFTVFSNQIGAVLQVAMGYCAHGTNRWHKEGDTEGWKNYAGS